MVNIHFYDKDFAKALIDAGHCTAFDVRLDISGAPLERHTMARIDITLIMTEQEFETVLRRSIEKRTLDKD